MEMTMTITVPAEVSRDALGLWVAGMLNKPQLGEGGCDEEHQDEIDLLDELDDEIFVSWWDAETEMCRDTSVAVASISDAADQLRRIISLQLIEKLGVEHQSLKVVEELAELSAALVQYQQGRRNWTELAKEVADVLTVTEHVAHIVALDGRVDAEKFNGVVRLGVDRNWDDLSHMVGDYEDLEA